MFRKVLALATLSLAATTCGTAMAAPQFPSRPFECIAPAGPGGGWDTTMRMVTKVLTEKGIIKEAMPVVNKPGGGGGVALAYIARKKDPHVLAVYSPPLLLIHLSGQTPLDYTNVTPIAMMINDYGAFAVPKNSPYKTIADVFAAIKRDPTSVKVGGTSSPGSMDHIQFLEAARATGVTDLKSIPYVAFQGGEALAALMGGHIDLYSTGMAELVGPMEAGEIRVLALTSPGRIAEGPLSKVPTLKEQGIDATFINWRGIFGIPNMPAADRQYMENALRQVSQSPEWAKICKQNGWTNRFMGSEEFAAFLEKTNEQYKTLLTSIGMYNAKD